ncbi:MAG TPA: YaeQ family protein [Gemmatimonadaceae bacterium]|nr:YaeQ family protein [Gemmatimonadaceae bacterium]
MALGATIHNFDIQLSNVDRGVYETLAIRAARHPSETAEYLATRVLAYCLEYTDGIAFSKGLAEPDEPAVVVRDLTGALRVWIEVGAPDAARLHKAAKAAPRVVVYTYKDPMLLVRQLQGERIHRAEEITVHGLPTPIVEGLVERLDRRTAFELSVTQGHLYLTIGRETIDGEMKLVALAERR